jgi:cytosine/adenosine deaminase-related metal-dependent hydrolase
MTVGRSDRKGIDESLAALHKRRTTNDQPLHHLKARYVFPAAAAPIPDGVVTIRGERIVAVGKIPHAGRVEDLGNVAVLPGLVNAHSHLDLSGLAKPLGRPGMAFVDWLRLVIDCRLRLRDELERRLRLREESERRLRLRGGLEECLRLGTTTLGDILQPGEVVDPMDLEHPGVDVTAFLELIGPTVDRVEPAMELARRHVERTDPSGNGPSGNGPSGNWRPGLAPHAPYSVHPELLRHAVQLSRAQRVPIAMHLAESHEEIEWISSGGGPLRDFLAQRGVWEKALFRPGGRALDYLRPLADAHRTLVIHGNYLDDEEIALLAEHAGRMAVVFCPRTHAYFGHDPYPLEKMLEAGVVVALGTDSRASSPDLSVLAEMRLVAQRHPAVDRRDVLRMGTIRAAEALGRDGEVGSLESGKWADLAIVALPDIVAPPNHDAADPYELLFDSEGEVVQTWCRGRRI